MTIIKEDIIDRVSFQLDANEGNYNQVVKAMKKEAPFLLAYPFSDGFELLTDEERQYLLYLIMVIWKSVHSVTGRFPTMGPEEISIAEEKNWEQLNQSKERRFHERISSFFQDYPQEDLLAFAEDALAFDEEDNFITAEGREYMFVALKSVIDCLE